MTKKQKREEEKKFYSLIPQKYRKYVDSVGINEEEWIDGQTRKIYFIHLVDGYDGGCGETGYSHPNRSEVIDWLRYSANKFWIPCEKENQ